MPDNDTRSQISVRDLGRGTREVMDRVLAGETLVVTLTGRPVAVLSPYLAARRPDPGVPESAKAEGPPVGRGPRPASGPKANVLPIPKPSWGGKAKR